jgi:hypothetical protein
MRLYARFNSRSAAKWEAIRTKGLLRFILLRGVLGWGLGCAAFLTVFHLVSESHFTAADIALPFVVFPVGGVLFGYLIWNQAEATYRAYLSRRELDRLSAKP